MSLVTSGGIIFNEPVFCTPNKTSYGCGAYGTCNAYGTGCTCDAGYVADVNIYRFPTCSWSLETRSAVLGTLLAIAVTCGLVALASVRGSRGIPYTLCIVAMFESVFNSITMALLIASGNAQNVAVSQAITVGFAFFWCLSVWVVLVVTLPIVYYVVLGNAFDLVRRPKTILIRIQFANVTITSTVFLVLFGLMVMYRRESRGWNVVVYGCSCYLCSVFCVSNLLFGCYAKQLDTQLEDIIKHSSRLSATNESLATFRVTLRRVATAVVCVSVPGTIAFWAVYTLYMVIGPWPYSFVFFTFIWTAFCTISISTVYFAHRFRWIQRSEPVAANALSPHSSPPPSRKDEPLKRNGSKDTSSSASNTPATNPSMSSPPLQLLLPPVKDE